MGGNLTKLVILVQFTTVANSGLSDPYSTADK